MLAELLASHGFIVVCISSIGKNSMTPTVDSNGIDAEFQDLKACLLYAKKNMYVKVAKIYVIGYSLGAIPAIYLGIELPEIKAVATLDGSHCYFYKIAFANSTYVDSILKVPFLQLNQKATGKVAHDNTFFDNQTSGRSYYIRSNTMTHADFSSFYLLMNANPRKNIFIQRDE
ncbi:MAG: hypothetical protein U5K54_26100 [Cytophagales bacterium]|nr:hypothetical protein [Cytophagales bacterium]